MTRRFALVLLVSAFGTISAGAVAPVLPRFIESALGGSSGTVGVLVAIASFCALVGALAAGPQVDRYGPRRVALAGLACGVAGALLLVPAHSVGLTAIARMFFGLGAGAAGAATITWAVDESPAERRGRAIGVYGMTVWVGLSLGPQLGQAVANARGYRAVWLLVAGLELAALLLVAVLRTPVRHARELQPGRHVTLLRRLVPLGAGRPAVLIALASYGEGVILAFLVLHLIHRGVHAGAGFGGAASVFTVFAASVLAFRIATAGVIDRVAPERVAVAGFGAEALGLATLAAASSFGVAAVGACLMGAGFAVLFPALALAATRAAATEERGAALASFGASYSLGAAAGSVAGGIVAELWGTGAALLSAALLAGSALAYLARRAGGPSAALTASAATAAYQNAASYPPTDATRPPIVPPEA